MTFDIQLPYGEAEDIWQENVWSFNVTVDSTAPVIENVVYDEAAKTLTVTEKFNKKLQDPTSDEFALYTKLMETIPGFGQN